MVIWGTNVVVNRTRKKFRDFLTNFRDANEEMEDERPNEDAVNPADPLYIRKIYDVCTIIFKTAQRFFIINHSKELEEKTYLAISKVLYQKITVGLAHIEYTESIRTEKYTNFAY